MRFKMALIEEKFYEINHIQKANPNRKYNEPGKLAADCDPNHYDVTKDYHIPLGNPALDAMVRDNGYHHSYFWNQSASKGVTSCDGIKFPTPIVTGTKVTTIQQPGTDSTHEVTETLSVDIHKQAKAIGGYGFDTP